jgi:ABC-type multidrug transport system ATPase subunit
MNRGLVWRNVVITAKADPKRGVPEKQILNNLSGNVCRGDMLTIMGATGKTSISSLANNLILKHQPIINRLGSGKTTLLNFLSGRLSSRNLENKGDIILDNILIDDFSTFNNIVGYVLQEDILLDNLTPKGDSNQ